MNTPVGAYSFYEKISDKYDRLRFSKPYYQSVDKLERAFIRSIVTGADSVLEIGCGTGRITRELSEVCFSVTAVDFSAQMIEQARKKVSATNVEYVCLSLFDVLRLSDYGRFDAVVCMRVLPHIQQTKQAIHVIADAIVPSGKVVFDLWNNLSFPVLIRRLLGRRSSVETYYLRYPQMRELIDAAGLTVVDSFGWGYPRLGTLSADRLGNWLSKSLAYSVIFHAVRVPFAD
jgi:2-polyprenyl-3-methyl-5-hydroxy-6-metoxy-1,4-benzoquinol methylase